MNTSYLSYITNATFNINILLVSEDEATERLTTWSNVKQQRGGNTEAGDARGRTRTRENENNINNNMDSSRKSRSVLSPPDWSDRSQLQEFAQHLQGEAHNKARLERLR